MKNTLVSARLLAALLLATPALARDDDNKPVTPAPEKQPAQTDKSAAPGQTQPTPKQGETPPKAKTPPKVRASAVSGAASRLATNFQCSGCKGDGQVVVKGDKKPKGRGVGSDAAPATIQPTEGTRKLDGCKGCDGTGLKKGDTVWKLATNFVDDLAQLDLTDPEWASSRKDAAADGLQKAAQLGLDRLARKINEPGIEALFAAGQEPRKQRVALVGAVAKTPEIGAGDIVIDTSRGYLMLRSPIITRCLPGDRVLLGGVWSGMTEVAVYYLDEQGQQQERRVPARVLESSFVVAP